MSKYVDVEKLISEIEALKHRKGFLPLENTEITEAYMARGVQFTCDDIVYIIQNLQQEQPDEQPEYGYLSIEYVHGKKSRWNVGDVLAYYICTSNEEGEDILGKIVSVEFDEEDGWVYTFEDESTWDEQSLVEEGTYKKN